MPIRDAIANRESVFQSAPGREAGRCKLVSGYLLS